VVLLLIGLLAGIEALREFVFAAKTPELFYQWGFVPARYSPGFWLGGGVFERAIPFVSYMFLHADWTHLLVNCIWLLPFGSLVARRYGTLPFLGFFLLCGIIGAGVHLACNWGSTSPVIGASAAVSGLMGAAFRMLPHGPNAPLQPLFSSTVLLWTAVWIALNVFAGLTGFGVGPGVQTVAWQAHIGGYFAGLLLAGPFDLFRRHAMAVRA
jgi:membrane associated rhomboid family serine protease